MSALEQSKFPQSVKWSSWNLSTLWKLALNMLASHQSHHVNRSNRAFLSLARFWFTGQSLCMNRVKSLLSMCCILLGYSFESRPNSRAVGTAGSVLIIGSSRKNQFDARKQDWLVQKFGLRRFQRFKIHVIQAGTPFDLLSQENKRRRVSQGASESPFNNSLLTFFFLLSFSKASTFLVLASLSQHNV